jgi:phosphoribosylformimino-5-aminoimidazole carboxamide ribotide isomerase
VVDEFAEKMGTGSGETAGNIEIFKTRPVPVPFFHTNRPRGEHGMRVVPVLDLKDGEVVRAVAGRRQEYQPIRSRLSASSRPVDVARVFRERLGLRELYLADLNAIAGEPPALKTYAEIQALDVRLWVDAGVWDLSRAALVAAAGVDTVVIGLETLAGPQELAAIVKELESRHVLFSLDLKNGQPLGAVWAWPQPDARAIAQEAIARGVRRLLVLDLERVGVGAGSGTEDLCGHLLSRYPDLELVAGGGIRDALELRRLRDLGIAGVLIASALHDGRLQPSDWLNL